jgi:hypothetical protein
MKTHTHTRLNVEQNNPARKGEDASSRLSLGENGRFVAYAVHTRFDDVSWFVEDTETLDEDGCFAVIRQESTLDAALHGLPARLIPKTQRFGCWGRFALTVEDAHLCLYDAHVCDASGHALPVMSFLPGVGSGQARQIGMARTEQWEEDFERMEYE